MFCCLLLRIQFICQKLHLEMVFALTVEWICYFIGLWLHCGCHLEYIRTLQLCCFLYSFCIVSCYFEKRGRRKGWLRMERLVAMNTETFFFLSFSFGGSHLMFVLFLSGCSRKFLLLCEICIILGFYLKFLPVYALSECTVVFTMRDKCWWDTCPS